MARRPALSDVRPARARWSAHGAVAAMGLAIALAVPLPGLTAAQEAAVKAAYLYKFAPFADWPADAFAGPTSPFVICVQGTDPFHQLLDDAVAGQKVGGRRIVVARLGRVDRASGCQLAYLGGSAAQSRAAAIKALSGAHALTVTDEADGPKPHGMIQFVQRGGRVRFDVDLRQAEADGLTISSKLLALAVAVAR